MTYDQSDDRTGAESTQLSAASVRKVLADNSGEAARQPRGRPFTKGRSGNPRGRPKRDYDIAALARQHAPQAIATLVEIMTDVLAPPGARLSAANSLLERGFGRAPLALNVAHHVTISDEFEAFLGTMRY